MSNRDHMKSIDAPDADGIIDITYGGCGCCEENVRFPRPPFYQDDDDRYQPPTVAELDAFVTKLDEQRSRALAIRARLCDA